MSDRPLLRALADRAGILREYLDFRGTRRLASDATRSALLAAMGFDASSEHSAGKALAAIGAAQENRILEPTSVITQSQSPPTIRFRPPAFMNRPVEYSLSICVEGHATVSHAGRVETPDQRGETEIRLRDPLPLGYHNVELTLSDDHRATQRLIVAPTTCAKLPHSAKNPRLFGLWTNLYSVRGERDLGVGDFAALRELIDWTATLGASFIGLNPLHALRNRGSDVSPYRPVSRLYRSALYLDIEAIPEFASCAAARSKLASSALQDDLRRLRTAAHVRYDAVFDVKLDLLDMLFGEFMTSHGTKTTPRGQAYRAFLAEEGESLENFATFMALDEHFRRENPASQWPSWPAEFRDPRSSAVADFRKAHRRKVDFHRFLQFELERQLADLAESARRRGIPIGLYNDLALSTALDGFEPWAYPDLFVRGASLGAPPDDLGPQGQNWSLPPLNPLRLRETGYEFWRKLLRRSFASAGAIRIDHVMGLLRQFWIPQDMDGTDGAYVGFPADDLFAILALESRRANAIVIGEDLGTIPWGFDRLLERWGVFSTRVLYFERDAKGEFREPSALTPRALTTVSTHDLAPLAGFWRDKDLTLRRKVGQLATDAELDAAKHRRDFDRQAFVRRMQVEKFLPPDGIGNAHEVVTAAHAYLARCPSALVGVSLDDLALETEPVNLPGIGQDLHPNWSRRMSLPLAELRASPQTARMLAPLSDRRFDASPNVQESA